VSIGVGALHCDEYRTFWIHKGQNDIAIGTGYVPGVDRRIYYYHSVPYKPRYISVSSATPAMWKINKISDVCIVTPEPTTMSDETTVDQTPTTPICSGKLMNR
jgi:hypothetical protein